MIPLAVPNLSGNERKYLNQCIDTTFVSSVGEFVTRIEKMSAEISGVEYGVATSAGTTGLHLALMGVGVTAGEIVIIPTFTFIATANAVAHCGAIPWLMDIEEKSMTLDVTQLRNELKEKTRIEEGNVIHIATGKRVAAIMPVYTLGNVADMDEINKVAREYNLPVIADAAAAIGATYKGRALGTLADLTVYSFNGNKTITAGGGGMVVGNDESMIKKIKHISTTARVTAEYDHDMVGYNYRMTNIQAAVGCAQLERVNEFVNKKRYIRNFYEKAFNRLNGISTFSSLSEQESACWFSGIIIENGNLENSRKLCKELKNKGIEARTFWKPVHLQKPYSKAIKADSLDRAEKIWSKIITLPCSTGIKDDELSFVTECVIYEFEN